MLLVPVFAFVTDTVMTMRGSWGKFFTSIPLRFGITGLIFYLLVNIQGSFQAVQQFNRFTHFTNFVVAHAHLALLGAFTFVGMGFIEYAVAHIYERPIYSRVLSEWMYWLILVGFTGFFWSLTIAGFIQGQTWLEGTPEVNALVLIRPWYIARAAFGAMIVLSGIVQAYNIWQTTRQDTRRLAREEFEAVRTRGVGEAHPEVLGGTADA
jgi:cbb3-type cytochrome oxidase subunit 1